MYDESIKILDYLPIRSGSLLEYINHLWGAFEGLIEKEYPTRPFAILPYHLLFMLAVQYRVYRLSAVNRIEYLEFLKKCRLYDKKDVIVLEQNPPIMDVNGLIYSQSSVRNLSKIQESHLFIFLDGVLGLDDEYIELAKSLVSIRGDYSHANGNIEKNIEEKIDQYISILDHIQPKMNPLNDQIASEWLLEIEEGEIISEFVEQRLVSSFLCHEDFNTGILKNKFPIFD